MRKFHIFCSLECNREYYSMSVAGYPGDGHETHCENCGAELDLCVVCQAVNA